MLCIGVGAAMCSPWSIVQPRGSQVDDVEALVWGDHLQSRHCGRAVHPIQQLGVRIREGGDLAAHGRGCAWPSECLQAVGD